jgi:hypothetical protein
MGAEGKTRFRINLKDAHIRKGVTIYGVAKATGIPYNTVSKYLSAVVVQYTLPSHVIDLIEHLGLSPADPDVISFVKVEDKDEDEDDSKAPLALLA